MAFFHGFLLALGLILPLGAQNVFLFNQGSLQPKWIDTLPAVIIAGLCDTFLIVIAVLGVSVIILHSMIFHTILLTMGILFLIYMGITTWRMQEKPSLQKNDRMTFRRQVVFSLSVSLLNPHAIMDTVGVIGISSLQYHGLDKMMFTFAAILVSFLWFVFLTISGRIVRQLNEKVIPRLNKLSAVIMWGSAVYLLFHF